jgi:hypothetical protein
MPDEATVCSDDSSHKFEVHVVSYPRVIKTWLSIEVEADSLIEAVIEGYAEFRVYLREQELRRNHK